VKHMFCEFWESLPMQSSFVTESKAFCPLFVPLE
jgi:hypothetical protein